MFSKFLATPPARQFVCIIFFIFVCQAVGAQFAVPTLDPLVIPKYKDQMVVPPAMPKTVKKFKGSDDLDYYEIAVRQFKQQILPAGMPMTTVWSYGSANHPSTFNYPAFTIEARTDRQVRVKWINQLVDAKGNYLPHLLPVDQTIHWANPGSPQPDSMGMEDDPYTGPVPIVTHLHGGHTDEESDGFPEAWFLPNAKNIPDGFSLNGSAYQQFRLEFFQKYGVAWEPGSAMAQYRNDQHATTLWYHDHALGMTRLNVYAGPAGFYLLRGGKDDLNEGILPGPAPQRGDNPGMKYYEIPIAIQDRSFNKNGSLFFPSSRAFFDGFTGPYAPDPINPTTATQSDIAPIYNPEFFGNTIVVNGKTWPNLNVEPRRYRFRLLDGCNARTLKLKLVCGDPTSDAVRSGPATLPFWQIGADGGFLPAPVRQDQLLVTLAERADVIVDFSSMPVGKKIMMINRGPDEPINGVEDTEADPQTTGQVMQFTIVPLSGKDPSTPPAKLRLPQIARLGASTNTRRVTLNELDSAVLPGVGPSMTLLGVLKNGKTIPHRWVDAITELPKLNQTEIWEIYNLTVDAHPIHLHQIDFEVLDRTPMEKNIGGGSTRPAEPWEMGPKDTVLAYPGEVTRIKAHFDIPGLYVWHCHIIDHEDNEMMRPMRIIP